MCRQKAKITVLRKINFVKDHAWHVRKMQVPDLRMSAWPRLSFCLHAINRELIDGFLWNLVSTASLKQRSDVLHPASCTMVIGSLFHGSRAAEAWLWPPTPSSAKVKERVELYFHSSAGPSWPVLGWTLPFFSVPVSQSWHLFSLFFYSSINDVVHCGRWGCL